MGDKKFVIKTESQGSAIMGEDEESAIKTVSKKPTAKMEGVTTIVENVERRKRNSRAGNHHRNQLSSNISNSHDLSKVIDQPVRTKGQF